MTLKVGRFGRTSKSHRVRSEVMGVRLNEKGELEPVIHNSRFTRSPLTHRKAQRRRK